MPLVNSDDELAGYLAKAKEMISHQEYTEAIKILQTVLKRPDPGFSNSGDGHRYTSLLSGVNDLLRQLGPEGLAVYRKMYDAEAQRHFDDAVAAGDLSAIATVARNYRFTSYGPKALEMLAAIQFDTGRFSLAAIFWDNLLKTGRPKEEEPLLLAKIAIAWHMCGESGSADKALESLKKDHPDATAELGGKSQNLAQFVESIRKLPPFVQPRNASKGWTGLGGESGSTAIMADSDAIAVQRWRQPGDCPLGGADAADKVIANKDMLKDIGVNYGQGNKLAVKLKGGVLRGKANFNGSGQMQSFKLPPYIHPLVVNDLVIYRTDAALVACDGLTGQRRWATVSLPMVRKGPSNRQNYYYGQGQSLQDPNRHMLTAADGKVFTVYNYRTNTQEYPGMMPAAPKQEADSSNLVAVSVDRQGSIVWDIGSGRGDDDFIKTCKFFAAPTYSSGRLYAMAMYLDSYHLVCLDADTGRMIWHATVSQAPASFRGYGVPMALNPASPPAVVDGKVYVSTNGGVVAAYEAETGLAIWAYQYDSGLNTVDASGMPRANRGGVNAPDRQPADRRRRARDMPAVGQRSGVGIRHRGRPA